MTSQGCSINLLWEFEGQVQLTRVDLVLTELPIGFLPLGRAFYLSGGGQTSSSHCDLPFEDKMFQGRAPWERVISAWSLLLSGSIGTSADRVLVSAGQTLGLTWHTGRSSGYRPEASWPQELKAQLPFGPSYSSLIIIIIIIQLVLDSNSH